jgi:hypothetical protein
MGAQIVICKWREVRDEHVTWNNLYNVMNMTDGVAFSQAV